MSDILKRLGKNVRRLRDQRGQSQETFADLASINRTYVSDIERGARNPTVRVLEKIAKTLGVSPGSLLDEDEDEDAGAPPK